MAENSAISWTDDTFNPFIGCTKVSPACDGCYAEHMMDRRMGRVAWGGPGKGEGTRLRTSAANWKKPLAWDRKAARDGVRRFVFCASLADVFDNAVPPEWRRDLFDLIRATPNLTWLLLTKRPGNIVKLFLEAHPDIAPNGFYAEAWPRNAAIGCTVVTQEEADRDVPKLLAAKAALNPAFAFLSMEPLLGPVDLGVVIRRLTLAGAPMGPDTHPINWVITGGETDQGAHKARPANPAWFRSLRDQCAAAGVPFHFKQNGEWVGAAELPHCFRGRPEVLCVRWPELVWRVGKNLDPCTLDGVRHDARPR
jgi:protein gp37